MRVTEFTSELQNGEFLLRFTFEDDTDVYVDANGWECMNWNNIKSDDYYINRAKEYYETVK